MTTKSLEKPPKISADEMYPEIEIREIKTRAEIRKFVAFGHELYKDCKPYVPALQFDEVDTLDPRKNPAYAFCEAKFLMAYIDGKPVGRICGLLNHEYNRCWDKKAVRFTRFDYIDDLRVSEKLMRSIEEWARSLGMTEVEGPMGFCDFDREGMLVEGFEYENMFFTIYNYPYYVDHMEKLGYEKATDWIEYRIEKPEVLDERIVKIAAHAMEKNNLRTVRLKKSKEVLPYARGIFDLLYESYKELYGYIPLTDELVDMYVGQFVTMVRPEFLSLIVDENNKPVAFGLVIPSMSEAAKKSGGKLFPFGFIHILKALNQKKCDTLDFMLVAVDPVLQNRGVNAQLLVEMFESAQKFGVKYCETGPMLEDNHKIHLMWKRFDKIQHHRRRCYIRKIAD